MPAAPLDVNWEAVRAHAVIHGIRPTAEHYGIAVGTLLARSSREGWLKREPEPELPATMQPKAVNAIKPHQAASSALERHEKKGKLYLAATVHKTARHMVKLKGKDLLERVPAIAGLATAHAKLFPEQTAPGPLVSIQLLSAPVEHTPLPSAGTVEHAPMLDLPE